MTRFFSSLPLPLLIVISAGAFISLQWWDHPPYLQALLAAVTILYALWAAIRIALWWRS